MDMVRVAALAGLKEGQGRRRTRSKGSKAQTTDRLGFAKDGPLSGQLMRLKTPQCVGVKEGVEEGGGKGRNGTTTSLYLSARFRHLRSAGGEGGRGGRWTGEEETGLALRVGGRE
eukprot:scaffold223675_cov32-Tisochrysis_lutea.AAC.1